MEMAIIGLGKMGGNMARRLSRAGHRIVAFNRSREVADQIAAEVGLTPAYALEEVAAKLRAPRHVWLMLPAGAITTEHVEKFMALLSPGDTLIDGGNTHYKDDARHAAMCQTKGINFVDVGTSGGIWGLTEGYSMMIGGKAEAVNRLRPVFESLAPAPDKGWGHVGPHGAGHYVKMVHNGIEYGMMQAYAEGFEIMKAKKEMALDLAQISRIWQYGSVVRSWLLDLTAEALAEDAELSALQGYVPDSGEGRWTVFDSIDLDVPAPVITLALMMRFVSRQEDSYAAKLLAALRHKFGGHAVRKA